MNRQIWRSLKPYAHIINSKEDINYDVDGIWLLIKNDEEIKVTFTGRLYKSYLNAERARILKSSIFYFWELPIPKPPGGR